MSNFKSGKIYFFAKGLFHGFGQKFAFSESLIFR